MRLDDFNEKMSEPTAIPSPDPSINSGNRHCSCCWGNPPEIATNDPANILILHPPAHIQSTAERKVSDLTMSVGNKHTWQTHAHQMISKPHPHPEQYPCVAQTALEENGRVMYAPLRMLPPSVVDRHRPCAEFNGSDHYRFVPDMHPRTSYRQGEYLSQDKKRSEADNAPQMVRQPCPRYHPGFQQDNQQMLAATRDLRQEQPTSASSRNDVQPYALWRPEDEERGSGSNHYGFGPAANAHTSNPEREHFHQDRKKLKVVNGVQTMKHQPYPSYPHQVLYPSERGFQRDSQHIFRQEKPNSAASRNDVRPCSLWCPEDEERANASSRHGSGPDTNPKALYPESEYIQQDRKRLKVEVQTMVRQPYPSYSPEVSHPSESGFQRDSQAASRKDVRPRSLWCLEEERVSCSNQYGSGPDTNLNAPNPVSLSFDQDRKRLEVDDGKRTMVRQPCPSYQPQVAHASEHALASMAGELRNEITDSSNGERPHLLWVPEDEQHLTELHCFVRKHCVFIFCATRKDVGSKFNDENDS